MVSHESDIICQETAGAAKRTLICPTTNHLTFKVAMTVVYLLKTSVVNLEYIYKVALQLGVYFIFE